MMKLAYRVLVVSLFCLSLAVVSFAQTAVSVDKSKRSAKDDRNTAPTVGTGGSMGGPTGLFTVYDGQTLRKGEFTFSAAYSNFDRDPGDADITEVPISFQVGVTNYFELSFNTDAYRGVKINSPGNLSSFYMPNSGFNGGAIILAPSGPGAGILEGSAVFRPAGTQPFLQFPFAGSAGNFGNPIGSPVGPLFGFPVGNFPTIGGVVAGGGADAFPGLGSVYGSILPGIVFQTVCTQSTAPGCEDGLFAPSVFSAAPSYLVDAPFINRTYGQSAFGTMTAGAKFRFNDVTDWWGIAAVAQYRFYGDSADDFGGFNQLQRGASPGGKWNRGDILVTAAFDGRFKPWWNLSANVGYHWNADVKSDAFGGDDVTILDRPDEFIVAVGTDFPVNRYFQLIGEFRHVRYVGGRTPNAFENNPYDGLVGVRVFPARWLGFGFAYRHHFNQQDRNWFDDEDTVTQTAFVPCLFTFDQVPEGKGGPFCETPFIATSTSYRGVPPGFRTSSDEHGFIIQAFIGKRNPRQQEVVNQFANVESVTLSDSEIKLGCEPGFRPAEGESCNESTTVTVTTVARDPENDTLIYRYDVTGGRIVGEGASVTWDLSGVAPGTYTITTAVDDGCGFCGKTQTQTVTVAACNCVRVCECPSITVIGPNATTAPGSPMSFTANVAGGTQASVTYNWTVSNGSITSGQGTPSISVDTTGLAGQSITATVEIGGLDPTCNCPASASETGGIDITPEAVPIDEFGRLANDDIRARLDSFFAELSNNPNNQGYIINYGTPREIAARERLITNHISFRGFDRSRITIVNGGTAPSGEVTTKLYRIPPGADNPTP